MSDDDREVSPTEQAVCSAMDDVLERLYMGNLGSIAVCGTNADGTEFFFFLDMTEGSKLRGPINKLLGLYEWNERSAKRTTAPGTNRSYRAH